MNLSPNRRAFLRGVGACLFLPTLESVGAPAPTAKGGVSGSATRLAYLYFPNGSAEGAWVPRETGPDGTLKQLNEWMSPLEDYREDLIVTRNLWTPRGNGHAAGTATWLTGGSYDGRRNDVGGCLLYKSPSPRDS